MTPKRHFMARDPPKGQNNPGPFLLSLAKVILPGILFILGFWWIPCCKMALPYPLFVIWWSGIDFFLVYARKLKNSADLHFESVEHENVQQNGISSRECLVRTTSCIYCDL